MRLDQLSGPVGNREGSAIRSSYVLPAKRLSSVTVSIYNIRINGAFYFFSVAAYRNSLIRWHCFTLRISHNDPFKTYGSAFHRHPLQVWMSPVGVQRPSISIRLRAICRAFPLPAKYQQQANRRAGNRSAQAGDIVVEKIECFVREKHLEIR